MGCVTTHCHQEEYRGYIKMQFVRCTVMWELSSAVISSLQNSIHPPEMEVKPLKIAYYC